MAAASYLRGRFVCATYKSWDSFTDTRTGGTVSAGEGLTVYVYTQHDNELCAVVPEKKTQEGTYKAIYDDLVGRFQFGDEIEIQSGALKFGKYTGIFQVLQLEPAKK